MSFSFSSLIFFSYSSGNDGSGGNKNNGSVMQW